MYWKLVFFQTFWRKKKKILKEEGWLDEQETEKEETKIVEKEEKELTKIEEKEEKDETEKGRNKNCRKRGKKRKRKGKNKNDTIDNAFISS